MKLTLGFSTCPNDTFIFDAMVHGRIDTEGLTFEPIMQDVEALNERAFTGELDITKLSYHALGHLLNDYALLPSGSALGEGCGPLLISRFPMNSFDVLYSKVAVPGRYTTANFLFSLAYPMADDKEYMVFHEIENAILRRRVKAGVIIHENRFTYEQKGLLKVNDLGQLWENRTGLPIPLGGIVVKRQLPLDIQQKVARVMHRSVDFAFQNPNASSDFVKCHAQEMSEDVMQQHIKLYVNHYTLDLGEKGRRAVETLFKEARRLDLIPDFDGEIYVA